MFEIVLYQPEIPPNTGNIIRLCANTGCRLHLVAPLGFALDDRRLRRAGLDHSDKQAVTIHPDLHTARTALADRRWFALTTRGAVRHDQARIGPGDVLLFGPETRGLPDAVIASLPPEQRLVIPCLSTSRSLNLANAVAITVYEAWRQNGFAAH
ncbi:MAG: tRNA (cytidine(34)-2'-O)-methyltransferase [Wenzhouxiangellaceae bacterium]